MLFGINAGYPVFFTVISSIIAVLLIFYLYKYKYLPQWQRIGIALILGGAVGNLIDRIAFGRVVDFIDIDIPDIVIPGFKILSFTYQGYYLPRWPIFNVADIAVTFGIIMLLISAYLNGGEEEQKFGTARQ